MQIIALMIVLCISQIWVVFAWTQLVDDDGGDDDVELFYSQ
jgi:hypothetical protein